MIGGVEFGTGGLGAGRGAILFADLLIALLMGFEAASLQRWTLSRRNWRQLDIVVADDEESAERRFFDRWTAQPARPRQRSIGGRSRRAAADPRYSGPAVLKPPPPLPQGDIIGLFPEPGGSR